MNRPSAALAVFVKTPGFSPLKTRLAEGLGRDRAEEFYCLSLAALEATVATVAELNNICPYWAVAEEGALTHRRWQRFPRLLQGVGSLGQRLGHIFADLRRRYDAVIAIGADSPQITPNIIRESIRYLQQDNRRVAHVLGRCHDGGFYLVGTNRNLPPETWCNVPYSTRDAADGLAANLATHGEIAELPALTDVDQVEDLEILRNELNAVRPLSTEQLAVLNWLVATLNAST